MVDKKPEFIEVTDKVRVFEIAPPRTEKPTNKEIVCDKNDITCKLKKEEVMMNKGMPPQMVTG